MARQRQSRNLEIPGSMLSHRPGMTASDASLAFATTILGRQRAAASAQADILQLGQGADTLFAAVINGKLHVPINHAYALKDAARAHIDLESRATTGASILKP